MKHSSSAKRKPTRATTRIDTSDHVARHVPFNRQERCPETGEVLGVMFSAFELREGEKALSVNHLEYFDGLMVDQIRAVKADMVASGRTVGGQSLYAALAVNDVEACGHQCSLSLACYKRPEKPANLSHAEITGLPLDNKRKDLLEALAITASRRMFPVKKL